MRRATIAPIIAFLSVSLAAPAVAFGPKFCGTHYEAQRDDLRAGWRRLVIHYLDGRQVFRLMTAREWRDCTCQKDQPICQCCIYDNNLICAEVERINTTTADRVSGFEPLCKG